jgi:hypothetical protein
VLRSSSRMSGQMGATPGDAIAFPRAVVASGLFGRQQRSVFYTFIRGFRAKLKNGAAA